MACKILSYYHIIGFNLISFLINLNHLNYYSLHVYEIFNSSILPYCSELITGIVPYTDLRAEAQVSSFLNCVFYFLVLGEGGLALQVVFFDVEWNGKTEFHFNGRHGLI